MPFSNLISGTTPTLLLRDQTILSESPTFLSPDLKIPVLLDAVFLLFQPEPRSILFKSEEQIYYAYCVENLRCIEVRAIGSTKEQYCITGEIILWILCMETYRIHNNEDQG
jgi:hypothetical protein